MNEELYEWIRCPKCGGRAGVFGCDHCDSHGFVELTGTTYIFIARWHAEEWVRRLESEFDSGGRIERLENHYLVREYQRILRDSEV